MKYNKEQLDIKTLLDTNETVTDIKYNQDRSQ